MEKMNGRRGNVENSGCLSAPGDGLCPTVARRTDDLWGSSRPDVYVLLDAEWTWMAEEVSLNINCFKQAIAWYAKLYNIPKDLDVILRLRKE